MTGIFGIPTPRARLAFLGALPAAPALAQTPQFLGTYRDWNVYAFTEDGEKICYMASEPKKQEGNYTRRGNPAVLVTRRPKLACRACAGVPSTRSISLPTIADGGPTRRSCISSAGASGLP
jgi:hypothetical protein